MLRKYTLIIMMAIAFGMPFQAQAQTMDIVMKIESIFNQISEIRAKLKQIQSGIEIQMKKLKMIGEYAKKLQDGDFASVFGELFPGGEGGAKKKILVMGPAELVDNRNNPDRQMEYLEESSVIQKADPSLEDKDEHHLQRQESMFSSFLAGYATAVATRKDLDEQLAGVDQLKQDAESTESEVDLAQEIKKVSLLKQQQIEYQQLLSSSRGQAVAILRFAKLKETATEEQE